MAIRGLFVSALLLLPVFVEASLISPDKKADLPTTLIATVNVYDASLKEEADGKFKISFNISNKIKIQPEVRYGVLLKKIGKEMNSDVDRKVFDEILTLSEGQSVAKEIEYEAPGYFFGAHEIILEIRTTQGLLLDYISVGRINLSGTSKGAEINSEKCNFISANRNHENLLREGFYLEKEDSVVVKCPVKNNSSNSVSITPVLFMQNFSPYGEILSQNKYDEIKLQPQEEKEFSVAIPSENKNSARVKFITLFFEKNGSIISNKTESYVFFQAENKTSARILNVRFNKTDYFLGDTAELILNWDGIISNEAGSYSQIQEIPFKADLLASNGDICADLSRQEMANTLVKQTGSDESKLSLHVIRSCPNPTLILSLLDERNNILAEGEYKITTHVLEPSFYYKVVSFFKKEKAWILAFLIIIIFIWAAFHLIRRRMLYNRYVIPPFVFVFGLLWGIPSISNADTFYDSQSSMIYNISADKTNYVVNRISDQKYKVRTSIQRYYYEAGRPWIPGYHLSLEVNTPGLGFSGYGTSQWMTISTNLLLSYGQISGAEIEAKTPFVRDFSKSRVESYLRAIVNGSYVLDGEVLAKTDINLSENGECGKSIYVNEANTSDKACKFGSYENSEKKKDFGKIGKDGEMKWKCKNIEGTTDAECGGYVKFDAKCGEAAGKPVCDIEKYASSAGSAFNSTSFLCENQGWALENEKSLNGWGKTPGNFEVQSSEGIKSWICKGIHGGSNAVCSLGTSSKAVCGPAADKPSKNVPIAGLCSNGTAKGVERSWEWNSLTGSYVEKWKWICDFFDNNENYISYGCDVICMAPNISEP